jgi:DNA-binding NtrC family response regulator
LRILVLDDDDDVRAMIVAALRQDGVSLVDVPCACSALVELQTAPVGLVLADILMPGMTGLDLVQSMIALHIDVPVILMTAYPDHDATTVQAPIVRHVLAKPFAIGELRRCVSALRLRAPRRG